MSLDFKGLWVEKYRPQTLNDLIIDERSKAVLLECISKGEIPHLLFAGSPGIGKTCASKIIVNDILKCDYLYINASDENGIDTIRTKIAGFAQTKSFDGKVKVIICDEMDAQTAQAQAAMRNMMETYSKYTRFILTANHKHKIIPALQSRCQAIELKPDLKQTVKRCYEILAKENIKINSEQKSKFVELIKLKFPDIRSIINELQKNSISGSLDILNIYVSKQLLEKILQCIKDKSSLELRKYLIEHEEEFQGDYDNLMTEFLNYLYEQPLNDLKKKEMIAIIADHLFKAQFILDKEINCFACWINLEKV